MNAIDRLLQARDFNLGIRLDREEVVRLVTEIAGLLRAWLNIHDKYPEYFDALRDDSATRALEGPTISGENK